MSPTFLGVVLLLSSLVLLIAAEQLKPAREFPTVIGWRFKCVAFMPVIVLISGGIPYLLADKLHQACWLPGHRLGLAGGTVVGILISELLVYWAHRLHHKVPLLWRWIHQLHHSAERIDVFGAAYFHPFEIAEGVLVGIFTFNLVLGITPEATILAGLWQGFNGIFQHANIRTPSWLGYFVQRPEQHAIHHERGIHGFNYANLPLWDLVWGTFKNPRTWQGDVGFYAGSSSPTARMLMGHDISQPKPVRYTTSAESK
jgi:sterol desaturase/sphingolipid hydroxylase (fatty acid hydroxylase superfamily)